MAEPRTIIEALIRAYVEDPEETPFLRRLVREHHALIVRSSWTGWHMLRADGSVVFLSQRDPAAAPRPEPDPRWQLVALVRGAQRWSELRALLPRRREEPDCIHCQATGFYVHAHDREGGPVVCGWCAGLGWVQAS